MEFGKNTEHNMSYISKVLERHLIALIFFFQGAKKTFEKTEVETSFLAFETFVSKQKIFYFGTHLEFSMFKIVL